MENVDELRREAEEVKEKLKRDVLELRDILTRAADGIAENSQLEAEEAVRHAGRRIEETVSNLEKRFEKVIGLLDDCFPTSPNNTTREFDVSGFSNIEVDSAFRVEIIRSDVYNVSVCADNSLMDHLNVSKSGNTLKLSLKPHRFRSRPLIEAKIALPTLSKVRLGAATRGICRGFNSSEGIDINLSGDSLLNMEVTTGDMRCEVSGASRITGIIIAASIEFVLSGASRAELSGSAQNVVLNAWGASKAEMVEFQMCDADIHLKGGSEALVTVTGKMDIDLSSGSRLTYSSSPTIRSISVTGASSLNHQ
jgi:hypothetical protein